MAKFNEETIQKCVDWVCENGLIDYGGAKLIDFCNVMGIGKSTYYRWMENETFGTAIKKAKEDFKNGLERNVVSSLARSAIGYEYEQVSSEYYMEGKKKKLKKEVRKMSVLSLMWELEYSFSQTLLLTDGRTNRTPSIPEKFLPD